MRNRPGLLVLNATLAGVMAIVIAGCDKPQPATGTPRPATSTPSPATSTPPPSTTVGTELDDSMITARVKSALVADPDIKGFDFKVETRKGEVQLSGFVDNQTQIDRAIAVTRAVTSVKNVDNKVSVKSAATTVGNKFDDGMVTTKVKAALLADANVKSFDIAVVTRKGEVQLSGFVDNQGQIDRAIEVARGIEGVRTVGNEMSIKK